MSDLPHLILASGSSARAQMLSNVGLTFETIPADIDEGAVINNYAHEDIPTITERLASAKAVYVSSIRKDTLVIGSDQTLEFEGELISKSTTDDDAFDKLTAMSGKAHKLHSGVSVALNNSVIFSSIDHAKLTMHDLDEDAIRTYMRADPDALQSCVGGYKIEGAGAWLFDKIQGDNFTIMGMPLLPLLTFLRTHYKFLP